MGKAVSTPLFKKCIVFTDLHLGLRYNSKEHNEDCLDFLRWMVEQAKIKDAETCIFMGDFQHHRNTINVMTQNYMIAAMQLLNDSFKHTYFLVGNHDMYLRESRDVISSKFANLFPNITLIDKPVLHGDVSLVPWLVGEEWKEIVAQKSKYLFGHLELPGFKMNAMVNMPDHGGINASYLSNQDYVFSGHFHMRQTKGKVSYIGNPFGHNFSDVWDFDRGAMCLEWGGEPEYLNYTSGPRFISITLSSLLDNPDMYLKPKTHLQVILDIDTSYEDASFLRETFIEQYDIREFKLIRPQDDTSVGNNITSVFMKTVDNIVVEQLTNIISDKFDKRKLIEIYDRL